MATQEEIKNYLAQYGGNYSAENLQKIANDALQYGVSTQQLGQATGYSSQQVRDAFGATSAGGGSPVNSYLAQDFTQHNTAVKDLYGADKASYDPAKLQWGNTTSAADTRAAPGFNTLYNGAVSGDTRQYTGQHLVTNPTTGQTYDITSKQGGTNTALANQVNQGNWGALSGNVYTPQQQNQGLFGQPQQRQQQPYQNYGTQGMFGGTAQSRQPYTGYQAYQPYQGQQRTTGMFGAPTMNYNMRNKPVSGY